MSDCANFEEVADTDRIGPPQLLKNPLNQYFPGSGPITEQLGLTAPLSREAGYFRFGENLVLYGKTAAGTHSARNSNEDLQDVSSLVEFCGKRILLPFDPNEVAINLCTESYISNGSPRLTKAVGNAVRRAYYACRPFLPLGFRSHLQKLYLRNWTSLTFPSWPVDTTVDRLMRSLIFLKLKAEGAEKIPFIWFWPDGARAACVMTHDVEEEAGRDFCGALMDLNDEFQIPASFQIVPEVRYHVTPEYLATIKHRGYEVNVQDLNHDGRLYWNLSEFKRRAVKINEYRQQFGAAGFRAAILYRNPEWFHLLKFDYDMSIPNVAHLDPQRGGCCTVMPYFIGDMIELPLTTTQDHSIFHILHDYSLRLWNQQIETILRHNGLISFIVHPDYIIESRARKVYRDLLERLDQLRSRDNVWIAHPGEVSRWWRNRAEMKLVQEGSSWTVKGPDSERARVGFARIDGEQFVFEV